MGSHLRLDCHIPLWARLVRLNLSAGVYTALERCQHRLQPSWRCNGGPTADGSLMTGCDRSDWQAVGLAGWGGWNLTHSQRCPAGNFWLVWERPLRCCNT